MKNIKFLFPIFLLLLLFSCDSTSNSIKNQGKFNLDNFTLNQQQEYYYAFDVTPGTDYKVYVGDLYNNQILKTNYSADYVWFQLHHDDQITPYSDVYVQPSGSGGITSEDPNYPESAIVTPTENKMYLLIKGYNFNVAGTFGMAVTDSSGNKLNYTTLESPTKKNHEKMIKALNLDEIVINSPGDSFMLSCKVKKGTNYELYLLDSYNNGAFQTSFLLQELEFYVLHNDQVTLYEDIYNEPYNNGGITPTSSIPAAEFKAEETVVNIFVQATVYDYTGSFGFKLCDTKGNNVPYSIIENPEVEFDMGKDNYSDDEGSEYYDTPLQQLFIPAEGIWLEFNVNEGDHYDLFLCDSYNDAKYDFYADDLLHELWFGVTYSDQDTYYESIYSLTDDEGGLTDESGAPSASFDAEEDVIYVFIRPTDNESEGTIGIALMDDNGDLVPYTVANE